jgi:hypothetical protein
MVVEFYLISAIAINDISIFWDLVIGLLGGGDFKFLFDYR